MIKIIFGSDMKKNLFIMACLPILWVFTAKGGFMFKKKENMSFGQALALLKEGKRVGREGWNGKGMFIALMPALKLPPFSSQEPGAKVNDRTAKFIGNDTPLDSQPYFAMRTATGQWQPGWLASQSDLLSEDWFLVADADVAAADEKKKEDSGETKLTVIVPDNVAAGSEKVLKFLDKYPHTGAHRDAAEARQHMHFTVPAADADELVIRLGNMGFHAEYAQSEKQAA